MPDCRGILVLTVEQGKLVKSAKPNIAAGDSFSDARDNDMAAMSIETVLFDHKQYHGSLNDRLHSTLR